jgi:hypothetical protein
MMNQNWLLKLTCSMRIWVPATVSVTYPVFVQVSMSPSVFIVLTVIGLACRVNLPRTR